jgi:hypothetical protein
LFGSNKYISKSSKGKRPHKLFNTCSKWPKMTNKQQISFLKSCFLLDEADTVAIMEGYAETLRLKKLQKTREAKPRASVFLRMMLLFRRPEALQDFTEALGVYDNRQILDKEHMYKRFNPQVYILVSKTRTFIEHGLPSHKGTMIKIGILPILCGTKFAKMTMATHCPSTIVPCVDLSC